MNRFSFECFEKISCASPKNLIKLSEDTPINPTLNSITAELQEVRLSFFVVSSSNEALNAWFLVGANQTKEPFDFENNIPMFCNLDKTKKLTYISKTFPNIFDEQFSLTLNQNLSNKEQILYDQLDIEYSFRCPTHSLSDKAQRQCECTVGYYPSQLGITCDVMAFRSVIVNNCFMCKACPAGCISCYYEESSKSPYCTSCSTGSNVKGRCIDESNCKN